MWLVQRSANRERQPISVRQAERDSCFSTAHKALRLVVATTVTIYVVVSLAGGHIPGTELLLHLL
jgi:hypothetical protein